MLSFQNIIIIIVILIFKAYSQTCVACKEGTYANPDSEYCNNITCPARGMCRSANYCTECDAGYYQQLPNQTSCQPCPEGYFAYYRKSKKCDICPVGRIAPHNASTTCIICGPGNGTATEGSTECIVCGPGSYSPGDSPCRKCLPGTFNPGRGQPSCVECGEGLFLREMGSSKNICEQCPPGYFCPAGANGYPLKCRPNYFCPRSALVEQYPCPALQVSDQGALYCVMGPIFYVLLVGGIFLVLFAAWIIYHWRSSKNDEKSFEFEKK